jgi:hypothetical protein
VFKASIALVLIAFGALAYGWLSNDDTILYASIGASILAGLFLLRATLADRKAGYAPEPKAPRPERPAREPRERKPKKGEAAPARQRRGLDSDELTRQMDAATDDDSDEEVPLSSLRPQRGRRDRLPEAPAGAAWAEAEQGYDDTEFEEEDQGMGPPSYDADYGDEEDDDDYSAPAAQAQGAAADDFRSRLAAVLGSAGEEAPAPAPDAPRARRVTPVTPEIDEAPAAPKRRGRKKPEPLIDPEPEPEYEDASEEAEPEWVRIEDVPNIPKPAPTDEMIHYRPRRPAVAAVPEEPEQDEPDEPPAPRRRSAASEVRPVGAKRPPAPRSSGVTRVSPAEKTTRTRAAKPRDPDAPPPRRGRPPRPKP